MIERAFVSFEQWADEGRMYRRRKEAASWELGDWLLRGAVLDIDPGFRRSRAITGYSRSYLYGLMYTARAWPIADRSTAVSWAVHRALTGEKDDVARRELLKRAVAARWTDREAERAVRERTGHASTATRAYENRQVMCPCGCGHVFPIKGNKVARTGLTGAVLAADQRDEVHVC